VAVELRPAGSMVEVRVCDHGPGVAPELEPGLFRKFVRGKGRPDRGTGLGLFIVAEMARRQNGQVWYERRDDRTCFGFRLPRPAGPLELVRPLAVARNGRLEQTYGGRIGRIGRIGREGGVGDLRRAVRAG
jgi:histidine kinase/DNA gyrase B/HSP90-like ATPase